jgi:hypothetical protein
LRACHGVVPINRDGAGFRVLRSAFKSVAGPKGSFKGTGTPRGSNGEQGEIGKPKAVWWPPNSLTPIARIHLDRLSAGVYPDAHDRTHICDRD